MVTLIQHQQHQQHQQQQHQQQQHQQQHSAQTSIELNGNKAKATPHPSSSVSLGGLKIKASLQNISASAAPTTATIITTPCPLQYMTSTSTMMATDESASLTSSSLTTSASIVPLMPINSNSLLKQQLRLGLKDTNGSVGGSSVNGCSSNNVPGISGDIINSTNIHHKVNDGNNVNGTIILNTSGVCTAIQSLANAAERQAIHNNNNNNGHNGNIQPPTANNLHHQFMLHMAANPILKSSDEQNNFMQQHPDESKQQQQQQQQEHLIIKQDMNDDINADVNVNDNNIDYLLDQFDDKSDTEMLSLADENAGLNYTISSNNNNNNDKKNQQQQSITMTIMENENSAITTTATVAAQTLSITALSKNSNINGNAYKSPITTATMTTSTMTSVVTTDTLATTTTAAAAAPTTVTNRTKNVTPKPIQRRRIRRKAQSSLEDPAEQLTEMSVRGLDLFRYASINEGVYQCTECAKENLQKTFKNKYSFQRHAFLYHEGKQRKVFPCTLCGKGFSRPDKMKNHIKMVHDVINFNSLNFLMTAATAGTNERIPNVLSTSTPRVAKKTRTYKKATDKNHQLNNTRSLPSTVPTTPLPSTSISLLPTLLPPPPPPPPLQSSSSSPQNERNCLIRSIDAIHNGSSGGGGGGTGTGTGTGTGGGCGAGDSNSSFRASLTEDEIFSTNIEIKNEIIISPSPSPPSSLASSASQYTHSFQITHKDTKNLLKISTAQATSKQTAAENTTQLTNNAQILAEVK